MQILKKSFSFYCFDGFNYSDLFTGARKFKIAVSR